MSTDLTAGLAGVLPGGFPGAFPVGPPAPEIVEVTSRVNVTQVALNVINFDNFPAFISAWAAAAKLDEEPRVLGWAMSPLMFLARFRYDEKAFVGWVDHVFAALDARQQSLPREVIVAVAPFVGGKHDVTRAAAVRLLSKQRQSQAAFWAVRSAMIDGCGWVAAEAMRGAASFHTYPREVMAQLVENRQLAQLGRYGDGYGDAVKACIEAALDLVFNLPEIDAAHWSELNRSGLALASAHTSDSNPDVQRLAREAARKFCPSGDFPW